MDHSAGRCVSRYRLVAYQSLLVCFPHPDGGQSSLVYFREIAKLREADYLDRYLVLSEDDLRKDVAGQIWRNSQIVAAKFKHLNVKSWQDAQSRLGAHLMLQNFSMGQALSAVCPAGI